MTILSALLGRGTEEQSHAERRSASATRVAAIETARVEEVAKIEAALLAVRMKAERQTAAEREALEAADKKAADVLAAEAADALAAAWCDYTAELSRASLQKLATLLRALNAKAIHATGADLVASLIVAAFAKGVISQRPETEAALLADDFRGEILSPAGRLLQLAVANAPAVELEEPAGAMEVAFAALGRIQRPAPTKEQRERFAAQLRSGRHVDRANRLLALAESYGAARQRAFEAEYVPATEPIKSHTHRLSDAI
jgi:hypothetical protein